MYAPMRPVNLVVAEIALNQSHIIVETHPTAFTHLGAFLALTEVRGVLTFCEEAKLALLKSLFQSCMVKLEGAEFCAHIELVKRKLPSHVLRQCAVDEEKFGFVYVWVFLLLQVHNFCCLKVLTLVSFYFSQGTFEGIHLSAQIRQSTLH